MALMLVPSPLMEPRYYLLPTLFVALHHRPNTNNTNTNTIRNSNTNTNTNTRGRVSRVGDSDSDGDGDGDGARRPGVQGMKYGATFTTVCDWEVWVGSMQVLLLLSCYTAVTQLLHRCYTIFAPLFHVVTLLLHCCDTG
jgi:hypothetical protein